MNLIRKQESENSFWHDPSADTVYTLQLDYTPEGDRCIYCNADAYTCEHYEEANQE